MDHPKQKASPAALRIIAGPEVWMEGDAERQLADTARDTACCRAVGMPDLHPGPGIPIGAVFGYEKAVWPRLVGSDAGCGALVVALGKAKLPAKLERRLGTAFDTPLFEADDAATLAAGVLERGPLALRDVDDAQALHALADAVALGTEDDAAAPALSEWAPAFASSLGSIGGGNHFAELGRVAELCDPSVAKSCGLDKGDLVLLVHSGSRGLGKLLADRWGHRSLDEVEAPRYLDELASAIRFARANRLLIAWRVLRALGVSRASKIRGAFDLVHNSVERELVEGRPLWVHRKGCAPAHAAQPTVVLGSRGTPSWILQGTGNPQGLSSVAHGAGRKMRRSEARDKLRAKYRRRQLAKSKNGGKVLCGDPKLLYEEHPDAYKAIEPVIQSLERAELAIRVASIDPLVTVKR